jgi:signal transduction histidine kinase
MQPNDFNASLVRPAADPVENLDLPVHDAAGHGLALSQASALKAHFFDLSLNLLCILDIGGRIEHANHAFCSMLRTEISQLQSRPFSELVYPDDRTAVVASLGDLDHLISPQSFACRFQYSDKTTKWYLWTLYPQTPGSVHAVGTDITPYKEMEAKEVERNIFAEALLDTVLTINSSLALDKVLERILSNVGKVVAYEYVSILLVDSDEAEVVGIQNGLEYHKNIRKPKDKRILIQDDEHLYRMFRSHESIIVPRLPRTPDWMSMAKAAAFLGSPIRVDNEVIGFLCVFNSSEGFFTPLHAQQLITFANQAGIAINNARLYEQAQSAAVLQERQRMAQELHDAVNQNLFAASTFADLLPRAISHKPQAVARYASEISKLIRSAVDQMRMILIELRPDTLTTTGLDILLQQLCDVFSQQTGIQVDFNTNIKMILEEPVQMAIYRVTQEALHNIYKHANATQVKVMLQTTRKTLSLTIEDNGSGFDQLAIIEVQFGIRGMRERARNIQADLLVESEIGGGTKIKLRKKYYVETKTHPHHPGG